MRHLVRYGVDEVVAEGTFDPDVGLFSKQTLTFHVLAHRTLLRVDVGCGPDPPVPDGPVDALPCADGVWVEDVWIEDGSSSARRCRRLFLSVLPPPQPGCQEKHLGCKHRVTVERHVCRDLSPPNQQLDHAGRSSARPRVWKRAGVDLAFFLGTLGRCPRQQRVVGCDQTGRVERFTRPLTIHNVGVLGCVVCAQGGKDRG